MKYTITVTAEDIANGRRRNCEACPVALALRRAIPDALVVNANTANLSVITLHSDLEVGTPEEVRRFMRLFDAGLKDRVSPFTFSAYFSEYKR